MFSFSRSKGKPVLVADVDSGSVGIGIVTLAKTGPARVVVSTRKTLPIESRALEQTATGVIGLLNECLAQLLKQYSESGAAHEYGPVGAIHAVIGVPWVRTRTSRATLAFPEMHTITNEMIQKLAKQALQEPSELDNAGVFESSVVRVQLNGYATARPIGKRAKNATVTVLQSDIMKTIREGVERALQGALPGRTVTIRSRTRALLAVLHMEIHGRTNCLVITVGTDASSCIIVRKDEITEQETISEGTATIARRVVGDSGLPDELPSMMRMIVTDSCTTPGCEAAKTALAKAESELVRLFGDTFTRLARRRRLPDRCIVSIDERYEQWFTGFMQKIDFSQFTVTTQAFSVEPLNAQHIRDAVTWNSGSHEETGLAVSAAFVNIH